MLTGDGMMDARRGPGSTIEGEAMKMHDSVPRGNKRECTIQSTQSSQFTTTPHRSLRFPCGCGPKLSDWESPPGTQVGFRNAKKPPGIPPPPQQTPLPRSREDLISYFMSNRNRLPGLCLVRRRRHRLKSQCGQRDTVNIQKANHRWQNSG